MEEQRITEPVQHYAPPYRRRAKASLHCLSCTSLAGGSSSASEMCKKCKTLQQGTGYSNTLQKENVLQLQDLPLVPPVPLCPGHSWQMATASKARGDLKVVLLVQSTNKTLQLLAIALLFDVRLPRVVLA